MNKIKNYRCTLFILIIGVICSYLLWYSCKPSIKISESTSTKKWESLFNGKDFKNWDLLLRDGRPEEISKVFTIDKDSSIHFYRDIPNGQGAEIRKNGTHGLMVTKRNYSKYHLKFEYKWGKKLVNDFAENQYDAGVYFHITELRFFPSGIQYQIRYDHVRNINYSGEIRSHIKAQWYSTDGNYFALPNLGGILSPISSDGWGVGGVSQKANAHGLDNEWNQCEIIVMGNEYVIFKLNGQVVNMVVNLNINEGPIALEAETGEIFWRNIEIKEFEHSVPMVEFLLE